MTTAKERVTNAKDRAEELLQGLQKRAKDLLAAEDRRHDDDHEHTQVLHDRHEARIGPELLGHADDARRAAGDHAERGCRRVEPDGLHERPAAEQAERQRGGADERDRQPGIGHGAERRGLHVHAEAHAGDGLGDTEDPGGDLGHHRRRQGGADANQQRGPPG